MQIDEFNFDYYVASTSYDLRVYVERNEKNGRLEIVRIHPSGDERFDLDLPALREKHPVLIQGLLVAAREHHRELAA